MMMISDCQLSRAAGWLLVFSTASHQRQILHHPAISHWYQKTVSLLQLRLENWSADTELPPASCTCTVVLSFRLLTLQWSRFQTCTKTVYVRLRLSIPDEQWKRWMWMMQSCKFDLTEDFSWTVICLNVYCELSCYFWTCLCVNTHCINSHYFDKYFLFKLEIFTSLSSCIKLYEGLSVLNYMCTSLYKFCMSSKL